ncbi:MAG: outer membrane beta-barrel domain-containing protein [Bdellovibrionales bacterium]|nr:outer membrane beta-barrel domain-containing protein [Oligoflexia bacterium]
MNKKTWSMLGLLLLSVFIDVSSSFAASDDDYNFSWLDPDKKIYVLQNRRYRKAGAPHLYMLGGLSLGDTYRNVYQVQPRLGFWFNEDYGFETFYSARFNSPNNAYKALDQAISTGGVTKSPYIREVKSQFGVLFNWAPWYAKINVFNSILYFDWYFSVGAGVLSTEVGPKTKDDPASAASWKSENLFALYLGTGHLFHLTEKVMIRWDVLGHFYSAGIYGGLPGAPLDKALFSNFALNLGVGLKL